MNKTLALVLFVLISSAVQAGQTPWVDVAPDTRLRLIFSDVVSPDNMTMMALEVEMPVGTKTYWRVPGETGIPIQVDFSASQGLGEPEIIWPFPERQITYGYVDHVYNQNLILPIITEVTGDNPYLEAEITLGICSDICVPVSVNISHDLSFEARDVGAVLRIAQAVNNAPIPWDGQQNSFGVALIDKASGLIRIEVNNSKIDRQSMIATIKDTNIMFGAPQSGVTGSIITFEKLGSGSMADFVGHNVTLTFMLPEGPYEYSIPLVLSE